MAFISREVESRRLDRRSPRRVLSAAERLWIALGAHPDFVESVFGDLTEEFASRASDSGRMVARVWYVREAMRSVPHLLWSGMRYGTRQQRLRIASLFAGVTTLAALTMMAIALRNGPPARLVAGNANAVVVNNQRPMQLPLRVLDAAGRSLDSSRVVYKWLSGATASVSENGVVTCSERGDAMVRASLKGLTTNVRVHCRPVRGVRAPWMLELVVGDAPADIPFEAVDMDGERETMLTGRLSVSDSSVATLTDQRLVARRGGSTSLKILIGDKREDMSVHVFAPARSPERMTSGQHLAIPVRLASGETRRWQIAPAHELYYIAIRPDRDGGTPPHLAIIGAQCSRGPDAHSFFCVAVNNTSVVVYNSARTDDAQVQSGRLLVWRQAH